ncbi:MAG: DUF4410 domain-containing protein [Vicinamibacterales bacterium]
MTLDPLQLLEGGCPRFFGGMGRRFLNKSGYADVGCGQAKLGEFSCVEKTHDDEENHVKRCLLFIGVLAVSAVGLSGQGKPIILVQAFTTAPSVVLPYDMKLMQTQLVAEFKVMLGKEFDIVAEAPANPQGAMYTLEAEITGWRAGNAAKRLLIGMGSGRESSDIQYRVTDGSGKKVVERKDTVRTNFYSQAAGSTGTLAHPVAQKIAERIKDAKLK